MAQKAIREDLIAAVGANNVDRPAIVRAINWLPDRALPEYLGKLTNGEQRPGILHELRVIGKLLRLDGRVYRVVPPSKNENFDALIDIDGRGIEVEITAHIQPLYETSIDRVCRRLEEWLRARFPGHGFHVRLSNDDGAFVERSDRSLDEDATFVGFAGELARAIDARGAIAAGYLERPRAGPIASIEPSPETTVYQGLAEVSANVDVERVRRKVRAKTTHPQWTGTRPAVLAVVLEHDPSPEVLTRGPNSVSAEAFNELTHLVAIAGLPFGNTLATPDLIHPGDAGRRPALTPVEHRILRRGLRFWVGVEWRHASQLWRHARDKARGV